ncbi:MAG TPA: preprotein translocase subunit YajC [Gemmataceae bacterium]|nr:preprotein translocase subunit YajC [Gemmataceae bacterium]
MLATLLLFAEDPPQGQPGWFGMLPFIAIAVVFLLMMMRNSRRQDRDRQAMLSTLDKNDKVLTIGGIYATVISVSPNEDEVVVKVDDNTRLKVTKGSISRNITKELAAAPPKPDAASSTAVTTKPNS